MRSENGNIATITALSIIPILAVLGGSVDFVRATNTSARLSAALESAALASANLSNTSDAAEVVRDYIDANFNDQDDLQGPLDIDLLTEATSNRRTVTITASGEIETYFLGLLSLQTLPVHAEVVASQGRGNVEIAMALDTSSSMRAGKLRSLKRAASAFVDQVLEGDSKEVTSVSVIPFGGTVNIGQTLFDAYAVSESAAESVDPSAADYTVPDLVERTFRFTDGNHCIEFTPEDYSDGLLPAQARGQVPHFWIWRNFSPWCPLDTNAAVMNSNDADVLKTRLEALTLSDGTGMDIGANWALKALSPEWQGKLGGDFSDRPGAYSDDVLKVMVLMSDGNITFQARPMDASINNVHTDRPHNNVADGNGSGDPGNAGNLQVIVSQGSSTTPPHQDVAVGYFKRVCNDAKASGIVIYTIGFRIAPGSLAEELLESCASDSTKYYLVRDLDIDSAFNSIAASISTLRVTG